MTEHDQGFVAGFNAGNVDAPLVEAGYDVSDQVHSRVRSIQRYRNLTREMDVRTPAQRSPPVPSSID